jgi:hypothetical protein
VLVTDTELIVQVSMISSWVIKICCGLGRAKAKGRRGGEASSFNLFPSVGERVNGVQGREVVSNSECAQVNGSR